MADADALREAGLPGRPTGPDSPQPAAVPGDDSVMSLVDHLGELRSRIIRIGLAVAVGGVVGFYLSDRIIDVLIAPIGKAQTLGPGDAFFIHLKISFVVGIILAMPVILYQGWAFIAPGLTPAERRTIRPWVPLALFFFTLGVAVAYFILPFATAFLLSFNSERLVNGIAAGPYFDFVTTLFLAFGIVMEFPIVLFGLSRVGVVTSTRLAASRRYVILGIAIFSAIVTPGGDLVSPFVMGVTMYVLYELTIIFIRRSGR
ncbi:MAG: twin-arginine translocase subunit TatC [Chloroflexota bacterium]